ncbi:MAG: DUF3592 domain-containing protein [Bryobacterales bacterium]|nr:DUF3592 domain-containing protein [Bryobacterales bacterium]
MKAMDWLAGGSLLILVILGLGLQWTGVKQIWRAIASRNWTRTEAVVNEIPGGGISFAYRVSGKNYESTQLHVGQTQSPSDSSEAELLRLRYSPGAKVQVFYDPKAPENAVARPGFHAEALLLPAAGLAFTLIGAMFLAFYFSIEGTLNGFVVGLAIFSTVFTLWGAAMLWFGVERLYYGHVSQKWPVAQGEIVHRGHDSSTTTTENEDGDTVETTAYSTSLVYSFDVGGQRHHASLRRFGQLAGSSAEWAAEIAERYPPGAEVPVFYHPENPDMAVLEPGINSEACFLPGAGLAVSLFSAALWVSGIPALTRKP